MEAAVNTIVSGFICCLQTQDSVSVIVKSHIVCFVIGCMKYDWCNIWPIREREINGYICQNVSKRVGDGAVPGSRIQEWGRVRSVCQKQPSHCVLQELSMNLLLNPLSQ